MKTCPRCAEKIRAEALVCRHCGHTFTAEEVALERRKVEARRAQYPNSLRGYLYRVEKNRSVSVLGQAGEQIKFPNWRNFWNFAQAAPAAQQAEVSQGVIGGAASLDPNAGEAAPVMHSRQGSDDVGQPRHQQSDQSDEPWYSQPLGAGVLIVLAAVALIGVGNIFHGRSSSSNTDPSASGSELVRLPNDDSDVIPVWRDSAAREAGNGILRAHGDHTLVMPYLACIAHAGDKVAVIGRPDLSSYNIEVIDGSQKGCTGNVIRERVE
jgi:hypothetical protein